MRTIFTSLGYLKARITQKASSCLGRHLGLLIIPLLSLFATNAMADDSGSCGDNITWSYSADSSTLTISGTGAMEDYESSDEQPWADLSFSKLVFKGSNFTVGSYAFSDDAFSSIEGLENVTAINDHSFANCAGLITLDLSQISTIGSRAFSGCKALSCVILNGGVTLNGYTFIGSTSLSTVIFTSSETKGSLSKYEFQKCPVTNLIVLGSVAFDTNASAFSNISGTYTLYYPAGSENEFSTWSSASKRVTLSYHKIIDKTCVSVGYLADGYYSTDTSIYVSDKYVVKNAADYIISIDKNAHAWSEWDTLKVPNCTVKGLMVRICKNDTTHKDSLACIIPDAHNWGEWNLERAATHVEKGLKIRICMNDTTHKDSLYIPEIATDSGKCGDNLYWYYNYYLNRDEFVVSGTGAMYSLGDTVDEGIFSNPIDYIVSKYNKGYLNLLFSGSDIKISDAFSGSSEILSIKGSGADEIGNNAFAHCDFLTTVDMPNVTSVGDSAFFKADLKTVNLPSVTTVGTSAFENCEYLTTVDMPSVTSVETSAFENCYYLTTVAMPNLTTIGTLAFANCGLRTVDLPNVTSVGDSAFFRAGLETVNLPSVTTVGTSAFENCYYLTTVAMPNLTTIGTLAFANCEYYLTTVDLPSVISVETSAFENCDSLTTVAMSNLTTVGTSAFANCNSLTTVAMPNLTTVGTLAFANCNSLTSVDMPSVTSVGDSAFFASGLKTVNLPSVTTVGTSAFEESGLTNAKLPNLTTVGILAFSHCDSLTIVDMPNVTSVETSAFENCYYLTTVAMPNATTIGTSAFTNCDSLTTIDMPSVTSVGESAFYSSGLKTANLPSVTTIGKYAFFECPLDSVDFPKVTSIGDYAFGYCSYLGKISIPSVVTIGKYAFFNDEYEGSSLSGPSYNLDLRGVKSVGDFAFFRRNSRRNCVIDTLRLTTASNLNAAHIRANVVIVYPGDTVGVWNESTFDGNINTFLMLDTLAPATSLSVSCSSFYYLKNATDSIPQWITCDNKCPLIYHKAAAATCTEVGYLADGYYASYNQRVDQEVKCEGVYISDKYEIKDYNDYTMPIDENNHDYILTDDSLDNGLYAIVCSRDKYHDCKYSYIKNYNGTDNLVLEGFYYVDTLVIDDSKLFYSPVDFQVGTLIYNRKVTEDTVLFVLPFNVPLSSINGTVYSPLDIEDGLISFMKWQDSIVYAGKPYMLIVDNKDKLMIDTLNNAQIVGTNSYDWDRKYHHAGVVSFSSYSFEPLDYLSGDYSAFNVFSGESSKTYVLQNGKFIYADGVNVKPFRAVLIIGTDDSVAKTTYNIILQDALPYTQVSDSDSISTGVKYIESETILTGKVNVYDILGRMVRSNVDAKSCFDGLRAGIYVVNGRKFIVRDEY